MGRFNPRRDVHEVYEAASAWSQRCLLRDDSILSDQQLWTKENVEELVIVTKVWGVDRFVEAILSELGAAYR